MKKYIIYGVATLALIGILYTAYNTFSGKSDLANFPVGYAWKFTDLGIDKATQAPKTQVTLTGPHRSYELGSYTGSCFDVTTNNKWTIDINEKQAVVCWFAGAGNEIGIFLEDGKYVVKAGDLGEPTGETKAFRGNFKVITTL